MAGRFFLVILFVLAAIAERLWFDLGPNVELVTLAGVVSGMILGRKWGGVAGVIAMVISDLVIGNTVIFWFTWSAFLVIGAGGEWLRSFTGLGRIAAGGGYGLAAAVFFYLYTNLGVWLVGNLYPPTFAGLAKSYLMGWPFFKIHAASSVLTLVAGLTAAELVGTVFTASKSWLNLTIKD